jgi:hypothetical protein
VEPLDRVELAGALAAVRAVAGAAPDGVPGPLTTVAEKFDRALGGGGGREAELRAALEEAEDRFESCDNCERPSREEDLKVIWGREAESGELVDARICLVCRLETDRDHLLAAFKERLLSDEIINEVADEWTEGEEGLHPSFVKALGETWLRVLKDAFAADADHLADTTKEGTDGC